MTQTGSRPTQHSSDLPPQPYRARRAEPAESREELRARIPGWGADLDPKDRPSVPRERFDPTLADERGAFPERQHERQPREHSIEHGTLPPVFGTAQPLHGLSGALRRHAYRRYSEGRAAHWLLLIAADRVDVQESRVSALLHGRPDNIVTETGIQAEVSHHGFRSRWRRQRTDAHQALDPVIMFGPWVLGAVVGYRVTRRILGRAGD
jgi:hypothetical protein